MLPRHCWLILCVVIVAGCSSLAPAPANRDAPVEGALAAPEPTAEIPKRDAVPTDVWTVLRNGFELDHSTHEPAVARALDAYVANPAWPAKLELPARRYFAYVVDAVQTRHMPMEVALMPIVESRLDPYAASHDGAAGLWQLIPSTARHLGVTMDGWYDGRRDPVDSTNAALDYLAYLHGQFGDWLLAMAAYNAGEGRVRKALAGAPRAGFFDLKLPVETKRYVPKVLALAELIATDDGLELPRIDAAPPFYLASIEDQIDIETLARIGAFSTDEIYRLNSGLNRRATPPGGPHRLLVPNAYRGAFESALDQYPREPVAWTKHRVRPGETLGSIAKRYHVSVERIRDTNGLSSNVIRPEQILLIGSTAAEPARFAGNPLLASSKSAHGYRLTYTVRRGDSLARIADRFDVSIAEIAQWNGLDRNAVLKAGKRLVLHLPSHRDVAER